MTVTVLWKEIKGRVAAGDRFAGLFATRSPGGALVLSAHVTSPGGIDTLEAALPAGAGSYPALTPRLGAAFWYEREIHDDFGVVPEGHPRLAPLFRPGSPEEHALTRHVAGYGVFTIPHGPVRSGVVESIEYLVETPGEAIPHLNMRVFYKHRGIENRYPGMTAAEGVLLAERTEGIASVAHALAYCHVIERIAGGQPPRAAGLVRVLYAELERVANHLDVAIRLADAAGLAVATARFALHKERVLRLVSRMCGSRFGRGVVIPGGVSALPRLSPAEILAELARLRKAVTADATALMATSSFLDRLRGTGPLKPERARQHGALGPIGKAAGFADDDRLARPYDAYPLGLEPGRPHAAGDAMARLRVR
ncbi:MAG TPA: NADH-quinone oxidoreductase subunit C, partial [Streptosporangiaceae bacterium]|nr:NADH-quinone oxidoreductase subunit C [Streptosporangiaceae bacterium]